jgi:DNA-binding transcriptional MerR regulator/quercetin dioxygenase-like cupin family protein
MELFLQTCRVCLTLDTFVVTIPIDSLMRDVNNKSVYYRIGEAAKILSISPSSLRNWERMGLLTPVRSQGRYRLYSSEELRRLRQIKFLRSTKHVNPAGIAAMMQEKNGDETKEPQNGRKANKGVAVQLLRLRRRSELTLVNVGKKTGLSPSFLSALEHGTANPSIATLQKLARLYDTNVLSFFGKANESRRLVHPGDRKVLRPNPGVRMELLALGTTMMEPHLFRIAPGATSGGSYDHQGEEFIFVLQGKLEMWLDEVERYVMDEGDALYFQSSHAHRWQNLSNKETLLLWINTPPTF